MDAIANTQLMKLDKWMSVSFIVAMYNALMEKAATM